jgi:hypothetical protein
MNRLGQFETGGSFPMNAPQCKPAQRRATLPVRSKSATSFANDEFETAVISELQQLRKSEKMLQNMYPRLKTTPQLRTRFLNQLAEMQLRAQRLDAVLNPVGALQFSRRVAATAPMSAPRTPVA